MRYLRRLTPPIEKVGLIRRGPRLRWHFTIHRPKRPLQMEHVTKIFLS